MINKKILVAICIGIIIPILVPTTLADHGESHDDCPNLADDPEHPCWKIVRTCADDIVVRPEGCPEEDSVDRDHMYVMFVNSTDTRYSNSFAYTTVTTAIYSTVQYPAVITIYVEDANKTPIGIAVFKTTLLEGVTPIEYGFTVPIECYYNTYDHRPICNTESPKKVYVNIFTDSSLTKPLTSEVTGTMMV